MLPGGGVSIGCGSGKVRSHGVSRVVDAVAGNAEVGERRDGSGEGEAC